MLSCMQQACQPTGLKAQPGSWPHASSRQEHASQRCHVHALAQRTRKEDEGVDRINGALHLLVLVLRPVLIICSGRGGAGGMKRRQAGLGGAMGRWQANHGVPRARHATTPAPQGAFGLARPGSVSSVHSPGQDYSQSSSSSSSSSSCPARLAAIRCSRLHPF